MTTSILKDLEMSRQEMGEHDLEYVIVLGGDGTFLSAARAVARKLALQALYSWQINTRPWMTHRASLEEVPAVFTEWMRPESAVLKALVNVE